MARRGRIIGMTFDGRAIYEPKDAGPSLTVAAARRAKSTCMTMPTVLSRLESGGALCINDVKSAKVAALIGPLIKKSGQNFGVFDPFGEWVAREDDYAASDPPDKAERDKSGGGGT